MKCIIRESIKIKAPRLISQNRKYLLASFFFLPINFAFSQNSGTNNISAYSFQGEKKFCCDYRKFTHYKVVIKGSNVAITCYYKDVVSNYRGVIKNGKVYSDNPDEKRNKDFAGNFYLIDKDRFWINTGNGEYDEFYECR
ncbi:MAG: hypothetical protein ABI861_00890 [Panacibacter sp.]